MAEGSEFDSRLGQEFPYIHDIQMGSGVPAAGEGGYVVRGGKAVGDQIWPLTSNQWRGGENMKL
jgi:hypothetical protein